MNYEKVLSELKTPLYVFDLPKLRSRIEYIKASLPEYVHLCYAIKANTFITKAAAEKVERLEVCSPGEFEICEELGVDLKKVVVSGVYKTPDFIERIISSYNNVGIYTVESLTQYELLKALSEKYKRRISLLIRVTSKNQFGISEEDLISILSDDKNEYIEIKGIQYFSATQKHSLKKVKREFEYLADLLKRLEYDYSFKAEELEYGTGFPVFYFKGESFDEDEFFKEFSDLLDILPRDVKLTFEVGRSIAASCGTYFTEVVDTKKNKVGNFAIIDGGINHLVYYGQSMAMKHPHFDVFPERDTTDDEEWNICGSLCTVNDIVVKALPVPCLKKGDTLIFKNTGAYCMCEGISLFLSRELPAVALSDDNGLTQVRDHFRTSKLNSPRL